MEQRRDQRPFGRRVLQCAHVEDSPLGPEMKQIARVVAYSSDYGAVGLSIDMLHGYGFVGEFVRQLKALEVLGLHCKRSQ